MFLAVFALISSVQGVWAQDNTPPLKFFLTQPPSQPKLGSIIVKVRILLISEAFETDAAMPSGDREWIVQLAVDEPRPDIGITGDQFTAVVRVAALNRVMLPGFFRAEDLERQSEAYFVELIAGTFEDILSVKFALAPHPATDEEYAAWLARQPRTNR